MQFVATAITDEVQKVLDEAPVQQLATTFTQYGLHIAKKDIAAPHFVRDKIIRFLNWLRYPEGRPLLNPCPWREGGRAMIVS